MMRKSTLSLLLIVILCNLAGATDPLTISKTSKPPKIDGVIDSNDPWTTTWINMTQNKGANTSSDVTGKFQLSYDENNLYLAVVCTGDKSVDTSSVAIPNSWENDCIEVFVFMDTTSIEGYIYKPGDYQFRMRRASFFPDRFDPGQMTCDWRHSDFKIGQKDLGNSYTQEWQMPWAVLADSAGMSHTWDGKQFKFDIEISDNTTGSGSGLTQQLYWCENSDNSWQFIQYFGLIKLLSTKVNTTQLDELMISPNPTNNKLRVNGELTDRTIINIYNIEGKQVLTTKIPRNKTVDVSYLRTGVYMVKIFDGKEKYSGKFIKR
jgi:hypothetical protein